jgi:predicted component of type VI protein secretion system
MGTKEILRVLVREIEAQVRRFEPRVEAPSVEVLGRYARDPSVDVLGRDARMGAVFAVRGAVSGRPIRFRLSLDILYRDVRVEAFGEGLD